MRYILSVLAICCFLSPNLPAADHDGFLGNWQLDTVASPQIDGRPVASATLTIDYRRKMVHLSKSVNFADRASKTVAMELKTDHRYHPVSGAGSGEFLAKWEGTNTLAAEHESESGHESIRLTLSPDGRILTETTGGPHPSVLIWKR
jgi:hypothetical protein